MDFTVAIDGPAASGKGTLAVRLGQAFGLPVLDTGKLYRAVGVTVAAAGGDARDAQAAEAAARRLDLDQIAALDLEGPTAGELASQAAVHAGVREALFDMQRRFALRPGGAILDGRDIGTVILPEAGVKLFVTASPEVRARRRWRQLSQRDPGLAYETVLADIHLRDARDSHRAAAPLRAAPDAVLLDTTDLDIEHAFDAARRIVETARDRWVRPS
ncbi:MAG: (d)CMP kinase [Alphaproteobacteria bacterium]|jgi:cytidylate kinase|nr:(d)CMP kinase [Alphaproteobacteria bacterium]